MRKILMFLVLIVSINSFGQNPSNYQYRTVRERLIAMMMDSTFHPPRYNGVPSGLRVGSSVHDGAFAVDTLNGHYYGYRNGAWFRIANYSDIAGASSNIYNSNGILTGNRTLTGLNNTYNLAFDSLDYFRVDRNGVTRIYQSSATSSLYSPDGNTLINIMNGLTQLSVASASNYLWGRADSFLLHKRISYEGNIHGTFYPYSLVDKSYVDSVAGVGATNIYNSNGTLTGNRTVTGSTFYTNWSTNNGIHVMAFTQNGSGDGLLSTSSGGSAINVQSTTTGLRAGYFLKTSSSTNSIIEAIKIHGKSSGTVANGFGSKIIFDLQTDNGSDRQAGVIEPFWEEAIDASRTMQWNIRGTDNATDEVYMNIQNDLVRINNNADTLATKAYARSVGGGSGSGTVNTGAQFKPAYYPSAGTTVDDWAGVSFGQTNINTEIIHQSTTEVGLKISGISSQTADFISVNNSVPAEIFELQADGDFNVGTNLFKIDATNTRIDFLSDGTATSSDLPFIIGPLNGVPFQLSTATFGVVKSGGASTYIVTRQGDTGPEAYFGSESGQGLFGMFTNHALYLRTNNANRGAITATGDFAFGATAASRRVHITEDNTANNTVTYVERSTHITSLTPGTGIGVGKEWEVETSEANNEIGMVEDIVTTDAGAGSEDFDYVIKLMAGGAAAAEKLRVLSTGELKVQLLNQDDAEAKVVVWNSTDKIFEWRDAATIGAGGGANTALSNLAAVAINTSLLPATDDAIDLGSPTKQWKDLYMTGASIYMAGTKTLSSAGLDLPTGGGIRTRTSAGNTVLFQAYDVDGTAYTTFATLTANNTPTFNLSSSVTLGGDPILTTVSAASTYQPLDADLTTISGLTATTDNFLVSVSSAWASRTPSQVRTTLALVIGTDVQAFDADLTTWAGITPGSNVGTFLATPSSANLRSALTDENGTGAALFNGATTPDFTTGFTIGGAAATGATLVGNGTNFVSQVTRENWTSFVVSGSDATTTGQTLVDITGLTSGTLLNSTKYEVEAFLDVGTSAVTTGTQYAVFANGTGGAAVYSALVQGTTTTNATTMVTQSSATQQGTFLTTSGSSGTVHIHGWITTRGSGTATISIQHLKVTSGTSTVRVGSWMKLRVAN